MRKLLSIVVSVLAGVILGSCQEKQAAVEEEISVNPIEIAAEASMKSYKIEVSSNAGWTLKVEKEPAWVVPDRSSGHDNATVSIRVLENKY